MTLPYVQINQVTWVVIELDGNPDHALNAFKTTDRGLVFIDRTGLRRGQAGPSNRDKYVVVAIGDQYIPRSMFPESGWNIAWESLGKILDIQIYW